MNFLFDVKRWKAKNGDGTKRIYFFNYWIFIDCSTEIWAFELRISPLFLSDFYIYIYIYIYLVGKNPCGQHTNCTKQY